MKKLDKYKVMDKMKFLKSSTFLLFFFSLISIAVCLTSYYCNHGVILYFHVMALVIADSLIILLPYWFLNSKWKKTVLIPVWAIAIYCLCSSMYFRFFHEAFPFSALLWWDNLDSNVTSNIPDTIRFSDIIFIILPAIVSVVCCKIKTLEIIPKYFKILMTIFTLIFYTAVQAHFVKIVYPLEKAAKKEHAANLGTWLEKAYLRPNWSALDDISSIGLVTYTIKTGYNEIRIKLTDGKLNETDKIEIQQFLKHKSSSPIEANLHKNVIFIIVESLNSWVIGKQYGPDKIMITPVLDSLINGENCFSALNIVSQICIGQSSDGQLIYNSGLLPLKQDVIAYNYGKNRFIGLAEALGRNGNFEVIYESTKAWNHDVTSLSYGYKNLYGFSDIQKYAEKAGWYGKDGMIFDYALDKISHTPQPFFCELTTLSMHAPYMDEHAEYDSRIDHISGISEQHRNYLKVSNYFDSQLGRFVENLKKRNLFDNTIIIIASDHHSAVEDEGIPNNRNIAFLAINTGIFGKRREVAGQIDVYPTILDIAGIKETPFEWRGLGISMLREDSGGAITHDGSIHGVINEQNMSHMKNAWNINEKIVKSNYFSHLERSK